MHENIRASENIDQGLNFCEWSMTSEPVRVVIHSLKVTQFREYVLTAETKSNVLW